MNWVVLNFGTLIKQGCASYREKWQLNPWSFIYFMCENASLQKLDTHEAMIFLIWSYQKFELPGDTGYIDRLRPGHTALYGLITAKPRQKVVSREADDVVRVDVEFKTSNSRFIDVVGRGEKSERCRTR